MIAAQPRPAAGGGAGRHDGRGSTHAQNSLVALLLLVVGWLLAAAGGWCSPRCLLRVRTHCGAPSEAPACTRLAAVGAVVQRWSLLLLAGGEQRRCATELRAPPNFL